MKARTAAIALALLGCCDCAVAGSRYQPQVYVYDAPVEARGCYYYRGRQTCGRYCYIEVDGHRYCRERAREAYPQAPVVEEYDVPAPSLK